MSEAVDERTHFSKSSPALLSQRREPGFPPLKKGEQGGFYNRDFMLFIENALLCWLKVTPLNNLLT
jgi:hypothetical protein